MNEPAELDVRSIPPARKHPTIHARLNDLAPGETLTLLNDHDPRPLRFELEHDHPGMFSFQYIESGPDVWRVAIQRT